MKTRLMTLLALIPLIFASVSMAERGTVGGGGGNLLEKRPTTAEDVNLLFDRGYRFNLPLLARQVFNGGVRNGSDYFADQRLGGRQDELSRSVVRKLYKKPVTIFDALDQAKIRLQDPACIDPETKEEVDASAEIGKNEICISRNRILARVSEDSVVGDLLSLLVHEYSHFSGTTEEEAIFLQKWTRENVPLRKLIDLSSNVSLIGSSARSLVRDAETLAKEAQTSSMNRIYLKVLKLSALQGSLQNEMFVFRQAHRLYLMSPVQSSAYWTAVLKIWNLHCVVKASPLSADADDVGCEIFFKGNERQLTVAEFANRIPINQAKFSETDLILRLDDGHRENIRQELEDVVKLLKIATKNLL